jgi:hypothetical protein
MRNWHLLCLRRTKCSVAPAKKESDRAWTCDFDKCFTNGL